MGDERTGPLDAGAEPTSGLPLATATDVTRASEPGVTDARPIPAPGSAAPARIGRYTILRVLGEGGMGTVYEAGQESPKRTVALKVIRAGYLSPELLRRFTQESQVLGRLQHPGIAQVYEAGMAKDERGHERPFFAMEFIKGVPLTEYVNKKGLGTRERLELIAKVCDAVYHAHQKGVIHRDLKPGNILVDESGQPKILDFGIARATDSDIQQTTLQTDIGQLIGTIPYMSPEQVSGDPNELDTRSDVYALGVIAYEILAGRLPYDLQRKMIHEAARIIKEEEPTRLCSINRTLKGDVETIIAKALEKDKVRRYQSAESLASDIRRYLKDEPIAARPASTWYQASKFARRNRGLVAGLATAFVLLVAGVVGTGIGLGRAVVARDREAAARRDADTQKEAAVAARNAEETQRKAAEAQRDKAEKIAEFMSDTLKGAGPSVALGRDTTMLKEMMDVAAARIETGDLKDAPEAELRLRGTIGNTYRELALFDSALRLIEPALDLARSLHEGDHPDVALSLSNMATVRQSMGRAAEAEPLFEQALEMYRRLFPGDHPDVAQILNNLAYVRQSLGRAPEAEPLFEQALEMRRRLFPGDHPEVALSLNNLAYVRGSLGRAAEAELLLQQALEMYRRLYSGDHPNVTQSLNNLAYVRQSHDRASEAEPLFEQALEMRRRLFPGDNPFVATSLNNLAGVRQILGRASEAELLYEQALEMLQRLFPGDHPEVANSLNNLATVRQSLGRVAEAEPLYRQALEMRRRLFPGDHPSVAQSLHNLAYVTWSLGRAAEAEPLHEQALDMYRRLFPGDHPDVAQNLRNLAFVRRSLGRAAEAEPLFREALEIRRRVLPPGHAATQGSLIDTAQVLETLARNEEAEPLWRELLEIRTATLSAGDWRIPSATSRLGACLLAQNKFAPAEPLLIEGFEGLAAATDTPRTPADRLREACERVVTLYESWDKAEPGKGYDAKAAEWRAKLDALTTPTEPAPATSVAPK